MGVTLRTKVYARRGDYMCFPNFEDVLEYLDLSEEEIHEMFEEE